MTPNKWLTFRPSASLVARIEAWKESHRASMDLRDVTTQTAVTTLLHQALAAAGFPPLSLAADDTAELDDDASGDTRR